MFRFLLFDNQNALKFSYLEILNNRVGLIKLQILYVTKISHLMVPFSHYVVLTSHVNVFLSHSVVSLFFLTFDGNILTLCTINIVCNCAFITFSGSFIFFSHLMVSSSHCTVPISHVTVLLSHSVVRLFFSHI